MRCKTFPQPKKVGISLTSMIDVIFLLLIFFVCTANFQRLEEKLTLDLTHAGTVGKFVNGHPQEQNWQLLQVQITNSQGLLWTIEGREFHSLNEVTNFLAPIAKSQPDIPVILDPGKRIPFEHVIDIFDLCRELGFSRIQFAAEPQRL